MQYPTTIIELDAFFSEEKRKKFLQLMNENFDIEEKDIDIYKARDYVDESEFASEIYAQMTRDLKEEY
jgi:uncharacterized tellurite resistance protein B-like protein